MIRKKNGEKKLTAEDAAAMTAIARKDKKDTEMLLIVSLIREAASKGLNFIRVPTMSIFCSRELHNRGFSVNDNDPDRIDFLVRW